MSTFDQLGLHPSLLAALSDLGFAEATPIQLGAIPPALEGRDVLASAKTGSGKTAAFALPIIQSLIDQSRGKTRALVLVPTRELAAQVTEHITQLAKHTDVKVAGIFGGVGFGMQIKAIKRGTDILVATPGRLTDHMQRGTLKLGSIQTVVLDEADRMLDMGFLPAVRRILETLPAERQTLFFSATMPHAVSALVRDMLHKPAKVALAATDGHVETLNQRLYSVPTERKTELLLKLLEDANIFTAITFTRTKSRANRLAAQLQKANIAADLMHGDRTQSQRTRALDNLKKGKCRVLVATDLAARGIDVAALGHVINFDVPLAPEDYVHRIGRTARAKASGDALTFVSRDEESLIHKIEYTIGKKIERAINPLDPKASTAAPKPMRVYSARRRH